MQRVGEDRPVPQGPGLSALFTPCSPCSCSSTIRTKVYAILELWVQVCGASAGVLQGGAPGETLLTHLLSDISPTADALKVRPGLLCLFLDCPSRVSCLLVQVTVFPFTTSCVAPGGALMEVCKVGSQAPLRN